MDRQNTLGVPLGKPLEEAAIQEFAANFCGELIRPEDDGYDTIRAVFNAMIDRRPALIARCTGVADVIAAVNFARENELVVAGSRVSTGSPATTSSRPRWSPPAENS